MGKWIIDKTFSLDYGHRVHTQKLNGEYSLDNRCVCRHFHGHRGTVKVHLTGDKLNEQGMVTDFKHLGWFKKFIDDVLDHKMILDVNDPALGKFYPLFSNADMTHGETIERLCQWHEENYLTIWLDNFSGLSEEEQEIYEGLILVPFVPTSENLAKWLYDIVSEKMSKLCDVSHIEFFETPKSRSIYYGTY